MIVCELLLDTVEDTAEEELEVDEFFELLNMLEVSSFESASEICEEDIFVSEEDGASDELSSLEEGSVSEDSSDMLLSDAESVYDEPPWVEGSVAVQEIIAKAIKAAIIKNIIFFIFILLFYIFVIYFVRLASYSFFIILPHNKKAHPEGCAEKVLPSESCDTNRLQRRIRESPFTKVVSLRYSQLFSLCRKNILPQNN